jgi:hypothetical protein
MSAAIKMKRREAEAAKARLSNTVAAIRHRTSPKVIAQEAVDNAREKGTLLAETSISAVKENPQTATAAAVAATAFLFRKPIGRLFSKIFRRKKRSRKIPAAPRAPQPYQEEASS